MQVKKDFNRSNNNNNSNNNNDNNNKKNIIIGTGRDSVFGIATRSRLDGPGIESRWGARFFHPSPDRRGGPLRFLYDAYRFSFPGVKRPGLGVNRLPLLSPKLKKDQSYISTPPVCLCAML